MGTGTVHNIGGEPIKPGGQYAWVATVVKNHGNGCSRVASLMVLQYYHSDTHTVWRSQKGLADDLGMTEKSVQRLIVELTRGGYLRPSRKFGGSYRYELTLPYPTEMGVMNPPKLRGMEEPNPSELRGMEDALKPPYPTEMGGHTPQNCGLISFLNSVQGDGLQPSPLEQIPTSESEAPRDVDPFEAELRPDQVQFYRGLNRLEKANYRELQAAHRDDYEAMINSFDD